MTDQEAHEYLTAVLLFFLGVRGAPLTEEMITFGKKHMPNDTDQTENVNIAFKQLFGASPLEGATIST